MNIENRKATKIILLLLLLFFSNGCSDKENIILKSYGIVTVNIDETVDDPNSVAGSRFYINNWSLDKKTTKIPPTLGINFGISYERVAPFYRSTVDIEQVIIFPGNGLVNPDTGVTQKRDSEFTRLSAGENDFFFYAFDDPWEIKPGIWTFQVIEEGEFVIEKKFEVLKK